jgi:carbon storage regulator
MLVLTCDIHDGLLLGEEVVVTVLDVQGGQVRLGINAPRNIEVHREEVYRRIKGLDAGTNGLAAAAPLSANPSRRLFRRKRRIVHHPSPMS